MSKFMLVTIIAIFSIASVSARTDNILFQTPLEQAKWKVTVSPLHCKLVHSISGFGKVSLEAFPASKLTLTLISDWLLNTRDTKVNVAITYPSWKAGFPHEIYSIPMHWVSHNKLNTKGNDISLFLSSLQNGLTWQFDIDGKQNYRLTASAIKTQEAAQQFLHCIYHLVPKPFNYIRNLTIYFKSSSALLSEKGEQDLNAIAAYYKVDSSIKKIVVDGYSDQSGYHLSNMALSQYRAENVTRRLIELGIPQSKILTRFHGDRILISDKKQKQILNRRVHIWIIKGNSKNV